MHYITSSRPKNLRQQRVLKNGDSTSHGPSYIFQFYQLSQVENAIFCEDIDYIFSRRAKRRSIELNTAKSCTEANYIAGNVVLNCFRTLELDVDLMKLTIRITTSSSLICFLILRGNILGGCESIAKITNPSGRDMYDINYQLVNILVDWTLTQFSEAVRLIKDPVNRTVHGFLHVLHFDQSLSPATYFSFVPPKMRTLFAHLPILCM